MRESQRLSQLAQDNEKLAKYNEHTAMSKAEEALRQRNRSESLRLAAEANQILKTDQGQPEVAAILALYALRFDKNPRAQDALQETLAKIDISDIYQAASSYSVFQLTPDSQSVLVVDFYVDQDVNNLRLLDLKTGNIRQTFNGHVNSFNRAIFSSDGNFLLTSESQDKEGATVNIVTLWDVRSGNVVSSIRDHEQMVTGLAISIDNSRIISGDIGGQVILWDALSGGEITKFQADSFISSIVFLPDMKHIAIASLTKGASIWEIGTGKLTTDRFGKGSFAVLLSRDGTKMFTEGENHEVVLWDVTTGRKQASFVGHTDVVMSMALSSDETYLVTSAGNPDTNSSNTDNTVRIWDIAARENVVTYKGHSRSVTQVQFDKDSKEVISLSESEDIVRRWHLSSNLEQASLVKGDGFLISMDLSPDGKTIATLHGEFNIGIDAFESSLLSLESGFTDMAESDIRNSITGVYVTLWDALSGNKIQQMNVIENIPQTIRFSPDGSYIRGVSVDETLHLQVWKANLSEQIFSKAIVAGELVVSPNSAILAVVGSSKVEIISAFSGNVIQTIPLTHEFTKALFSPDGQHLLTYHTWEKDGGANIIVWDIPSGSKRYGIKYDLGGTPIKFSPNGQQFLTVNISETSIWNVEDGTEVFSINTPPILTMGGDASFTPDGQYVVIGYAGIDNNLVEKYSIINKIAVTTFATDFLSVKNVEVSPDNSRLVVASSLGNLELFDLHTGEKIAKADGRFVESSEISNRRNVLFSLDGATFLLQNKNDIQIMDSNTGGILDVITKPDGFLQQFSDALYARDSKYVYVAFNNISIKRDDRLVSWQILKARTGYEAIVDYACSVIPRTINSSEKSLYQVYDDKPICPYTTNSNTPQEVIERLYRDRVIDRKSGGLVKYVETASIDLSNLDNISKWHLIEGKYSHYVLGANITWGSGSEKDFCGISFGHKDDNNFTYFAFNQVGNFGFQERKNGEWGDFSSRTISPTINTGVGNHNTLLLVLDHSTANVIINNENIGGFFKDSLAESGSAGILGASLERRNQSACGFSHLWLWDLEAKKNIIDFPRESQSRLKVALTYIAKVGENRGTLPVDQHNVWLYPGVLGERLSITVTAAYPANQFTTEERKEKKLLDVEVIVRNPEGEIIAEGGDVILGLVTDVQINPIRLTMPGIHEIEIYAWDTETGGDYSLDIRTVLRNSGID